MKLNFYGKRHDIYITGAPYRLKSFLFLGEGHSTYPFFDKNNLVDKLIPDFEHNMFLNSLM